jgi:hypothetical protein
MQTWGSVLVAVLTVVAAAGCSDGPRADGFHTIAEGDTYGEWELQAEYEDDAWTGCLHMTYDDDGPMCADPDDDLVRFEDWTGAQYGAVAEGERAELVDGSEVELVDGRFFVVIEGPEVRLAS